ncbi:MAG: outer membrane protein assembly factor BamC [Pseudomonadales bacterium]|nr:outer membrane protein assembly factor BamC [Halioglobus sp.]MCP5131693.1 outer membrane protein assembly factor BamC [Pseudomonadales bacterium]
MERAVKSIQLALLVALLTLCTGCGYLFGDDGIFRDKSQDYKKARVVPPLRLPDGDDSSRLGEMYPIPPVTDDILLAGKFEVPQPSPLVAGAEDEQVRIQTLADESWAVVNTAPGQVWPQVRAFLSVSQIPIARVDASAGIMESGWVTLEGEPMASRFQFRIDQGVQRGTSELHVLQMSQAGDVDRWPLQSNSPDQENQMLRAVSQYIANSADSTPVSMIADQSINASGKISVQEGPDDDIYILLSLPYDRAWASVGRAIEESNFEITDRDRSAGKYYVRFLGTRSEEEAGWFDWMLGSDDDPMVDQLFVVSVDSLDSQDVAIRIEQQAPLEGGETPVLERRDEQSLLALLKGNID